MIRLPTVQPDSQNLQNKSNNVRLYRKKEDKQLDVNSLTFNLQTSIYFPVNLLRIPIDNLKDQSVINALKKPGVNVYLTAMSY